MTPEAWSTSTDATEMLSYLRDRGALGERKFRLFAVACCRRIWPLVTHAGLGAAVEAAERFADGLVSPAQLLVAYQTACDHQWRSGASVVSGAVQAATQLSDPWEPRGLSAHMSVLTATTDVPAECRAQPALVRCIFGDPFHPAAFDPSWRTETALCLATRMYGLRDFALMPILADALQDAGCEEEGILNHCRAQGVHARGCYVVDLLLDRR